MLPNFTRGCISGYCPLREEWIHYSLNDDVLIWYQATSRGVSRISELTILILGVHTMGRSIHLLGQFEFGVDPGHSGVSWTNQMPRSKVRYYLVRQMSLECWAHRAALVVWGPWYLQLTELACVFGE